jgi:hypothetical protein
MYKLSDREIEIARMRQDVSGSLNELQRAASLVLEFIPALDDEQGPGGDTPWGYHAMSSLSCSELLRTSPINPGWFSRELGRHSQEEDVGNGRRGSYQSVGAPRQLEVTQRGLIRHGAVVVAQGGE